MYVPVLDKYDQKIVILTGAGLSAPSGIKTFRGDDGLWNGYKVNEVCNIETWERNFEKVHEFYNKLRQDIKLANPNKGHKGLADIVLEYGLFNGYVDGEVIPITQNVDDLLERAGVPEVMHIHGKIQEMQCQECWDVFKWGWKDFVPHKDTCPSCGSKWVKPAIVFFGETAPMYSYMKRAFESLKNPRSIFVVIGTSGKVVNLDRVLDYPCKKILCNLEASGDIDHTKFDKAYFVSVEDAIDLIAKDIKMWW